MTEVHKAAGQNAPDITPLLRPLRVGELTLKNRFVMPGMQRAWCVDGAPGDRLREYYRRRAAGGTALVISEACAVDHPSAASNPMFARLDTGTREAWRACVDTVHEAGGRMFLQLWHQGAVDTGKAGPGFTALSPSGLAKTGREFGRPASEAELTEIGQAFARGARVARETGADGVEVHACHGYLLDQFLWPETNQRDDRYGKDRAAFPAEVLQAVRAAVGPGFPVSIRLSQWKEADYEAKIAATPAELGQLVGTLSAAGADLFHVSTRRFWTPEWPGSDRGLAGWVKEFTDAPVIAVGSVGLDNDVMATLEGAEARPTGPGRIEDLVRRFERGDFDLVSIGRSLIGDPDWVAKMRDGRGAEVRPFRRADLEWLSALPKRQGELVRPQADSREGLEVEFRGPGEAGRRVEMLRGLHGGPRAQPQPAQPLLRTGLHDGEQQLPADAASLGVRCDGEGPDVRLRLVSRQLAGRLERLKRDGPEDAVRLVDGDEHRAVAAEPETPQRRGVPAALGQ
jgi:2,4-dienoyl-CoA reductase-like NADH-dependent reductase (Old Yellow Enzyme family)